MGNLQIYPPTFVDYTPTMTNGNASYPPANVKEYYNCKVHARSAAATSTVYTISFGSSKSLIAVLMIDINFTSVTINGVSLTATKNPANNRYHIMNVLTFTGSTLTITIPTQTATDGAAYFRVGTIVCLASKTELTVNPDYGYVYSAPKAKPKISEFTTGDREKIKRGNRKIFRCSFAFKTTISEQKAELQTLDALIDETDLFVFYENRGDTSMAFLCQKDTSLEISEDDVNLMSTNRFEFIEVD
jgi:hypothetical protein